MCWWFYEFDLSFIENKDVVSGGNGNGNDDYTRSDLCDFRRRLLIGSISNEDEDEYEGDDMNSLYVFDVFKDLHGNNNQNNNCKGSNSSLKKCFISTIDNELQQTSTTITTISSTRTSGGNTSGRCLTDRSDTAPSSISQYPLSYPGYQQNLSSTDYLTNTTNTTTTLLTPSNGLKRIAKDDGFTFSESVIANRMIAGLNTTTSNINTITNTSGKSNGGSIPLLNENNTNR